MPLHGFVTTESLKLRSGPSLDNDFIALLAKNDILHIYDKIDNWYVVKTENNLVGCVYSDYVELSFVEEETIETAASIDNAQDVNSTTLSQDEQIFFNLINNKRLENNLPELEIDTTLLNLARLKAKDMIENKYFSHTSPKYGTLFEILQNNNISYAKASENIAKNLNADGAISSFMNSKLHKNNILSEDFNYTGIAVQNSIEYGKIFVQIFVAK